MRNIGRQDRFAELFPREPGFRWKQAEKAFYNDSCRGWRDVTTLPKTMQETLEKEIPWVSYGAAHIQTSVKKDTYKAALMVSSKQIETVLMRNRRGDWTVCVSSQVGCAMRCAFCATGKMGFMRNPAADEIADQYRFWRYFLRDHADIGGRISNIVFMGMGEPLANYENVKRSVNTLLAHTDLGRTRITVSTVGFLPRLEDLLNDAEWPHVRLAVSLHSADPATRKEIVPTSYDAFLPKIMDWSKRYLAKFGNNRHHLTFEYVMLADVNDTDRHAEVLARFVNNTGKIKVNLIPYNFTGGEFRCSASERLARFKNILESRGVTVTVRKTMGDDIAAACGQLITELTTAG